jgi:leader peptidase (prepilin peptidase)/N-methyltransferase
VTLFITVVAGVYGLVVGSFLNVVIWRVPRHESIVKPRSHCPACDTQLATRDNIPVASWLILRGRCRYCGERISIRYPLIEILTGVLFAAVGARFAHSWALPAFLVLTAALIAISAIDLEHFIIPNRIVYPVGYISVVLLAFAALMEPDWPAFGRCLLAGLAAFTFFFVLHLVAPGGMGFGDVRLSFILGMFLGWLGWADVLGGLFAGFLYGAVIGMVLIVVGRRGRRQHIPFGPFLAAGTMTFVLFGDQLVNWWRGLGH